MRCRIGRLSLGSLMSAVLTRNHWFSHRHNRRKCSQPWGRASSLTNQSSFPLTWTLKKTVTIYRSKVKCCKNFDATWQVTKSPFYISVLYIEPIYCFLTLIHWHQIKSLPYESNCIRFRNIVKCWISIWTESYTIETLPMVFPIRCRLNWIISDWIITMWITVYEIQGYWYC